MLFPLWAVVFLAVLASIGVVMGAIIVCVFAREWRKGADLFHHDYENHTAIRLVELKAREKLFIEYLDFLVNATEGPVRIANLHGWRCRTEDVRKGLDYRKRLGILSTEEKASGAERAEA